MKDLLTAQTGIDPKLIIKSPNNVRLEIPTKEEIATLAEDLKQNGMIQPITLVMRGNQIECVCGWTRLLAWKQAYPGKELPNDKINWISADLSDVEQMRISLSENLERKNLTELEIAKVVFNCHKKLKKTHAELGKFFNKSESWISRKINYYIKYLGTQKKQSYKAQKNKQYKKKLAELESNNTDEEETVVLENDNKLAPGQVSNILENTDKIILLNAKDEELLDRIEDEKIKNEFRQKRIPRADGEPIWSRDILEQRIDEHLENEIIDKCKKRTDEPIDFNSSIYNSILNNIKMLERDIDDLLKNNDMRLLINYTSFKEILPVLKYVMDSEKTFRYFSNLMGSLKRDIIRELERNLNQTDEFKN